MADDEFDATKGPGLVLWSHILQKGFQAGSVLGVGAVAPLQAAYKAFWLKQHVDFELDLTKTVGKTTLGVFGLVAVLGALRATQIDRDGLEDRAYRLHYNKGQNRTDTFAQVGAVAGLATGAAVLRRSQGATPLHYLGFAAAGTAAGVALHMLTAQKDE